MCDCVLYLYAALLLSCLQQGHFLLVDPDRLSYELSLKEEAFATKRDVVVAAEERSLPAQEVSSSLSS